MFEVEVPIDKVPQPEPTEHVRYVYVRALSQDPSLSFNKAVRVVLSTKSLSVFVQTDKPVYRRNEDGERSHDNESLRGIYLCLFIIQFIFELWL